MIYILILIVAPFDGYHAGATTVNQEFSSREKCYSSGKSLVDNLTAKRNNVLAWGCYPK